MGKRTPLYEAHVEAGAKLVDFGGWDMPLHYGSRIEEHRQVRRDAGMFDVSHMGVVDIEGPQAQALLRRLLANDVARLRAPGKALYSCMLNEGGGVVDDLLVYYLSDTNFRIVINAATRETDLAWIAGVARGFQVSVRERPELAMIAIQGPQARAKTVPLLPQALRAGAQGLEPFFALCAEDRFVARTGYTGEDGFEIMLPAEHATPLWNALLGAGVRPAGLGARDTLRLEAGMNLYGADMDQTVTPLESGLGWTVAWEPAERNFLGREPLERQRAQGPSRRLVGLVLEDRGVLRAHQRVFAEGGEGVVTSGSFSPTLGRSIALARVPLPVGEYCEVEIRGRRLRASVVRPPFVRHGRSCLND